MGSLFLKQLCNATFIYFNQDLIDAGLIALGRAVLSVLFLFGKWEERLMAAGDGLLPPALHMNRRILETITS